jgi:Topoisomerase IA
MGHVRDLPKSKLGVDEKKSFRPDYRVLTRQEEGPGRAEEGGGEVRLAVHRDGPGSRRRGHRVAPRGRAGHAEGQDLPDHVQRDHGARGQGGLPASREDRRQEGERATGPARPRPSRRLQALPAPLGEDPARPVRGSCAVRGRAPPHRARARDPRLRAHGVLVAPRQAPGKESAGVRGHPARGQGREGEPALRSRHARGDDGSPRGDLEGEERHARGAPPQPRRPLHHLDSPAGGEPQAPLHRPQDHDAGPAALRRHRARRRGGHRSHHLHAHGRGAGGREAQDEAREWVTGRLGREYLPEAPPSYKSKKSAQEAHEAIRPSSVGESPRWSPASCPRISSRCTG